MAAKANRIHDVPPREAADKWVLVLAFLLGVCGAFALKYFESHPFLVALWSASILLVYVAATWLLGRLRIESEIIGDNCYYLGFVFTLASLAGTLYLLEQTGGQTEAIRDVISGFGVALTSTILGIILRVLLIRMRPDIVSRDREARIELHSMVRDFRANLSESLAHLKRFSVETGQILSEQRDEIRAASKETIEAQKQALAVSIEGQAKMVSETLAVATDKASEAIADAVANSATASHEELLVRIAGMREAVADLARKESEILKTLVENSTGISSEGDRIQAALAKLADRLEAVSVNLDAAAKHVSHELEPAANTIASAVTDAAKTTHKLAGQVSAELSGRRRGGFWGWRRSR